MAERSSQGRRRGHHTHEINDPYAEGYDARDRIVMIELARAAGHTHLEIPSIGNPYRYFLNKPRGDGRARQARAAELWDQGWLDRKTEIED